MPRAERRTKKRNDQKRMEAGQLASVTELHPDVFKVLIREIGKDGKAHRAAGEQIHPIADRRCVVRALTPSPSLLRGTRRRNVRLAEIGKIRAHQPHIGRHPIAEGRVRSQRENRRI